MKYSIIVPLYNRVDLTANFVQNIFPYLKDAELILVDNASSDNTFGMIQFFKTVVDVGERIKYIRNDKNLGFSAGNNIGAKEAQTNNLIFISNDVIIHGEFIERLKGTIERRFLLGGRLLNFDTGWNKFKELETPFYYLEGWFIACNKEVFNE